MAKKRGVPEYIWKQETAVLEKFIYQNGLENNVTQFSPYHFRIKTLKATIDVWAGSKKYFIKGTSGAVVYNKVEELLVYLK